MTSAPTAIMAPQAALNEPLVRRVLMRVLDRLDVQPQAERTHSIRINLDMQTAPEIHAADSLSARAVAWAAIDGTVAAGWAMIDYRKHRRHGAREEREPYLDFQWPDAIEDLMREKLNRPRKATAYASQWRILLAQQDLPISASSLAKILSTPIEINTRSIDEVLCRFVSIRDLVGEPLLLREVSSRVFWGLSKILDGRADAVAALLDSDECPFAEQPIVLNVHVPIEPRAFLFIENHVAFERLRIGGNLGDTALIFSSGFRGAAARLRRPNGCNAYYSRASSAPAIAEFERMLFSPAYFPVCFWGDLDYSGMAILASLRSTFPSAVAWKPGYELMLSRLKAGDGHSPAESGKERQRVIEATGCIYADEELLPALQATGKFLDQE
jgi:Uncharacterized protein conserved in bacteria C-term(DUF2220)